MWTTRMVQQVLRGPSPKPPMAKNLPVATMGRPVRSGMSPHVVQSVMRSGYGKR